MAMEWSEEYRELMDRFERLELSHFNLKQQFQTMHHQTTNNNNNISDGDMTSLPGWGYLPGAYFSGSPYKRVLDYMGHALYVTRPPSGQIIFWNRAAEKLFGYKENEIVGHRVVELLTDEERHHPSAARFLERLNTVESWSGQLPLKKRNGQIFMAIVTKTPLYEEGELVGIVTVAHDAAVFNGTSSGNTRTHHQDHDDQQPKRIGINLKKIQWRAQPQIAALPDLASSVSNLASKVFSRKRGDVTDDMCRTPRESEEADDNSQDARADRPPRAPMRKLTFSLSIGKSRNDRMTSEREETTSEFSQPSKIAAKVLSKLQIGATSNLQKTMDEKIHDNGSQDTSLSREGRVCQRCYSTKRTSYTSSFDTNNQTEYEISGAYHYQGSVVSRRDEHLPSSSSQLDGRLNMKSVDVDDASPRQLDPHKFSGSGESSGSSSSRGDKDSRVTVDCPILWKDLQLREEIGHGSFAVVYRGVWNGSDVAVKVYSGNQYNDQTLLDYKKEIDIMRRLRHPNVLLFMGAVCSEEKLAIVTEYMPRGSLFKTLHRNNHVLDLKRRLRMAIDVARGMNYLHHRSPPIVHRDLKSSNLLVDKSWTVKVGDFGLSKLKNATFLTAKSGRGTPQWMAPEVLRNEPTTEKSDVFSFGVILWELMTESIPWSNLNSLQVVGVVGFMDQRLDLPANMDPQVSSIISDCWRSNPEDRPSFEDIIHRTTDIVQAAGIGMAAKATSVPRHIPCDPFDA